MLACLEVNGNASNQLGGKTSGHDRIAPEFALDERQIERHDVTIIRVYNIT